MIICYWVIMADVQVIIFALTLLSYVQASEDIIGDNVGIVGGAEVSIKEAPYMAAFYRRGDEAFGAGSIIHEQFILTSASVVKEDNDYFHVLVGTDRLSTGGQLIQVSDRLCHEKFCEETDYDICLLKLLAPVRLGPKVAKINLPEKDFESASGILLNVTGWGKMEDNKFPNHLMRTAVALRDNYWCAHYYPNVTMTDNMICGGIRDQGPCMGDGGAPLTHDDMQVGVASFGAKTCGRFPSVFTKVSKFVTWINMTINNNL